jgi:phosphoribosylglycinamide formyltransferase-1
MKFGFICSAGGSSFFSAFDILFSLNILDKQNVKILTDRDCGALNKASNLSLERKMIPWSNSKTWSKEAAVYLNDVDVVLLFFTRLIDKELFAIIPTLNIHPSLLPSFKGFNAVEQAFSYGARFLGASLHMVDERIDHGAIIAQIINPIPLFTNLDYLSKVSYLQKTYLTLLIVDLLLNRVISLKSETQSFLWKKPPTYSQFANPKIITRTIEEQYTLLCTQENLPFLDNLYPQNTHTG